MRAPLETGGTDLVTSTYERLRDLIVHGRLAPGSRIVESDLASRLGVSRTPVRSALHRLQQEGFVVASETGRNARLSVSPLTQDDGREVLEILGLLEGHAAGRAAELEPRLREKLVRELRRLNDDLAALIGSNVTDNEQVFRAHSVFHQEPMRWIAAPRLHSLHDMIRPQAQRYRRIYIASIPSGVFSIELEEHEPIIDAMARGDATAAQVAVQRNWAGAAERLASIIATVGERGHW